MIWRNTTTDLDVKHYAKKEIEENLSNHKGYWKQSVVCKIAALGYYDMKSAWRIFNRIFIDLIDSLIPKEAFMDFYQVEKFIQENTTPAADYYGCGHYNGD